MGKQNLCRVFLALVWLAGLIYALYFYSSYYALQQPKTLTFQGIYNLANDQSLLLASLGFIPEPRLYPQSHHQGADLPVFVVALHSQNLHSFHRFLGSFRVYFRTKRLVVYDIGLTNVDRDLVQHTCQCLLRSVHWERYPSHVRDLSTNAYRPLLIQETLQEFGAVFWCSHSMRFNTSDLVNLSKAAELQGLVTWRAMQHPTSAFTHPLMFRYLHTEPSLFHVHPMAEPDMALYYNTYVLHHKLMLPWVICALNKECLAPPGSKQTGCKMDQQTLFAFTGCHLYDTSAFNILLGLLYKHKTPHFGKTKIFKIELSM